MKTLKASDVEFEIHCLPEETPYDGDLSDCGDETCSAVGCACWVRRNLDSGNDWAWCCVRVVARWNDFAGHAYLGACSYASESQFISSDYYADMRQEALADLNRHIASVSKRLAPLSE